MGRNFVMSVGWRRLSVGEDVSFIIVRVKCVPDDSFGFYLVISTAKRRLENLAFYLFLEFGHCTNVLCVVAPFG